VSLRSELGKTPSIITEELTACQKNLPDPGDFPRGYSYDNDLANSINSDQLIRDRAIRAGAPVNKKPRSDYNLPPEVDTNVDPESGQVEPVYIIPYVF
jgi:hypothetical protein